MGASTESRSGEHGRRGSERIAGDECGEGRKAARGEGPS